MMGRQGTPVIQSHLVLLTSDEAQQHETRAKSRWIDSSADKIRQRAIASPKLQPAVDDVTSEN